MIHVRRRKDLRRKARQLADKGRLVEYRVLEAESDVDAWAEDFLRVEASGWKGEGGTAMLVRPGDAAYFRAMCRGGFRSGQLLMLGLFLDGRPIAMKCNLVSGAVCSPTRSPSTRATPPARRASCWAVQRRTPARDAGGAVDGLFHRPRPPDVRPPRGERRVVQTQYVATGRWFGDAVVSAMPLLRGCGKASGGPGVRWRPSGARRERERPEVARPARPPGTSKPPPRSRTETE